jgi:hypothetical protein
VLVIQFHDVGVERTVIDQMKSSAAAATIVQRAILPRDQRID